jgi:hypothetical protein
MRQNLSSVKVIYNGQGVTVNEAEVEKLNKAFLGHVLKHGKSRAAQIGEENLEVHHQLLIEALRI